MLIEDSGIHLLGERHDFLALGAIVVGSQRLFA
jgi:hypothetical protein